MENKLLLLGYKEILAEVHATDCKSATNM